MIAQKRKFSISTVLPTALVILVVCTVAPILVVTHLINSSNASALLSARAELLVDGLEDQLRGLLDPIAVRMETARDYIEQNNLNLGDNAPLETYIEGFISGTSQVSGLGIIRPDGTMRRWEDGKTEAIEEPRRALPRVQRALDEADEATGTRWSEPFVSLVLGDTILNPRVTLRRNGETTGILTAGVTGRRLSEYVAELSRREVTAFILYNRNKLIAYPNRLASAVAPTSTKLPSLADSSLPIIRKIWVEQNPLTQTNRMTRTEGHWARINGVPYSYFYRSIAGYGPGELLVGVVLPSQESRWFRWASLLATGLGFLLLCIAVLAAFAVARRIGAPVVQLENALGKLESMKFRDVNLPDMQRSRIAEWSRTGERLTKTAGALALFNQYVPSKLARMLMDQPEQATQIQQRTITVMFIDMEGFSAFARQQSASETAEHLNRIFGIIGPIIEQSGGVIDKYTGDGLMAFWGAPDTQEDHRCLAISAAMEIRSVFDEKSSSAWLKDSPRLRIGLHSGPAIVGNLGFDGRVDYTIVGTTVNVAERTEQGLRGVKPERAVVIGLSKQMFDDAMPFEGSEQFSMELLNDRQIAVA